MCFNFQCFTVLSPIWAENLSSWHQLQIDQMADPVMILTDLPDLVLEKVFSYIDVFGRESDCLSFSLVCTKFRDIERRRTVLELGLGTNPVHALALYPYITALKADGPICRKWAAGSLGKLHFERHSLRVLDLSLSGILDLHLLFKDLVPGFHILPPDSSNSVLPATGPWGTLKELVIRGTDWLDLSCVGGNAHWKGRSEAARMEKLSLVGHTKVGFELIFDALGPALLSLDLSGLKRGRQIDQKVYAGEFVEDKLLT